MDDNLTKLLIAVAGMIWLLAVRYLKYLKAKTGDGSRLNAQDLAAMEKMAQTAQLLEQRVASLEKILDHEVPSWRSNPDNLYQQAG